MPYISGTIHHMTLIYVTHVSKDNISRLFLHFFQILIFRVNIEVKGQKMAQNDLKSCLSHSVSPLYLWNHTSYGFGFWYTCVKW